MRSLGTCPDAKLFVEVFFLCRNATPVLRSDLVGERVLVVFTYAKYTLRNKVLGSFLNDIHIHEVVESIPG